MELVMEVEDRFKVHLPEAECQQVRTVADLAALVVARLPQAEIGVCATARAFYDLRRGLVECSGVDRKRFRPGARLDEALGRRWRGAWRRFQERAGHAPRLQASAWAWRIAAVVAILGLLSAAVVAATVIAAGGGVSTGLILGLFVAVIGGLAALGFIRLFERSLPEGTVTVGDIARSMAAGTLPAGGGPEKISDRRRKHALPFVAWIRTPFSAGAGT